MGAPLTLTQQQQLPYPEKLALARKIWRRLNSSNYWDWSEEERIAWHDAGCMRLMGGDEAAGKQLATESIHG